MARNMNSNEVNDLTFKSVTGAKVRARTRTRDDAANAKLSQKNHLQASPARQNPKGCFLARTFAPVTFLDLSQVYGSDAATAASLRNADGTMKTQDGGLPIASDSQFMGGDVRASENPDLTSLDVLFVREHND